MRNTNYKPPKSVPACVYTYQVNNYIAITKLKTSQLNDLQGSIEITFTSFCLDSSKVTRN